MYLLKFEILYPNMKEFKRKMYSKILIIGIINHKYLRITNSYTINIVIDNNNYTNKTLLHD